MTTIIKLEIVASPKEFNINSTSARLLALFLLIQAHDINRDTGIIKPSINGIEQQSTAIMDLFLLSCILSVDGLKFNGSLYFDRDRSFFSITKREKIRSINIPDNRRAPVRSPIPSHVRNIPEVKVEIPKYLTCLLYTSPSPRD